MTKTKIINLIFLIACSISAFAGFEHSDEQETWVWRSYHQGEIRDLLLRSSLQSFVKFEDQFKLFASNRAIFPDLSRVQELKLHRYDSNLVQVVFMGASFSDKRQLADYAVITSATIVEGQHVFQMIIFSARPDDPSSLVKYERLEKDCVKDIMIEDFVLTARICDQKSARSWDIRNGNEIENFFEDEDSANVPSKL